MIKLSIASFRTEQEILKADPNDLDESNKYNINAQHRLDFVEKMIQGQRDEKFVQDYYEILKKADKFRKKSSINDVGVSADKWGMSLGHKDEVGRRYDHLGFLDPKHKHYGKTLGEVLSAELEERSLKDDDFKILYMFNNHPIIKSFSNSIEFAQKKGIDRFKDMEFPLTVNRENEKAINKIEQLTEFLHVKRIDEDHRILEFLIPKKFGVNKLDQKDEIFKELVSINSIWHKDEYGTLVGFTVNELYKITELEDKYDVIKFTAIQIKNVN